MVDSCDPPKFHNALQKRSPYTLSITSISYPEWNKMYDCNEDLELVFEEEEENSGAQEYPTPPPSPTPTLIEESHITEVLSGLYIACVNDENDVPSLRTFDDTQFTHVVQVRYTGTGPPPSLLDDRRKEEAPRTAPVQRLTLHCPASALLARKNQTVVALRELYAARDFLTLALPHGSSKWWPEEGRNIGKSKRRGRRVDRDAQDDNADAQFAILAPDYGIDELLLDECEPFVQTSNDDVNVLIVARRAVDVLSILFCYIAFLEDKTPEELVDKLYGDEFWENVTLGQWSMNYVGNIAKLDRSRVDKAALRSTVFLSTPPFRLTTLA